MTIVTKYGNITMYEKNRIFFGIITYKQIG